MTLFVKYYVAFVVNRRALRNVRSVCRHMSIILWKMHNTYKYIYKTVNILLKYHARYFTGVVYCVSRTRYYYYFYFFFAPIIIIIIVLIRNTLVFQTRFAMNSVALVIVMLLASHVNSSPIVNFSWDTPRHFCGSQLANVLALICSNGYNFHPVNDGQWANGLNNKKPKILKKKNTLIHLSVCERARSRNCGEGVL